MGSYNGKRVALFVAPLMSVGVEIDADEFNPWRSGQMRQIHARNAAAPDEPDLDFARLPSGGLHQDRRGEGRSRSLQKRPARGMGSRRRQWMLSIH